MKHDKFFKKYGDFCVVPDKDFSIEDLYQAFRERLLDEVTHEIANNIYEVLTGERHD